MKEEAEPAATANALTGPAISHSGLPLDPALSFGKSRRHAPARGSSVTLGKVKAPPYFEATHRGHRSLVLEANIDYDSFEDAAERWAKKLRLRIVSRADGPDARVWDCERDGTKLWLAYDDWFPTLHLEPQDADAGREIESIGVSLGVSRENA